MSEQTVQAPKTTSESTTSDGSNSSKAAPKAPMTSGAAAARRKWLPLIVVAVIAAAVGYGAWRYLQPAQLPAGFTSSNGRIEATEIDIATKLAGRLMDVTADEGDLVDVDQVVARMDLSVLNAQLHEANAKLAMAKSSVDTARSTLAQRESEKAAATSVIAQREAELDLATRTFARTEQLLRTNSVSQEQFDTDKATLHRAEAALNSAKAEEAAALAAIATAKTSIISAEANVVAGQSTVERIQADIDDSTLKTPRAGRVQYRVAQPGEVLPAGGKVLNMVDLGDVYMTFFLPTDWAGRVKLGAEVRIVLDAASQFVIPAKATFVADVAQFTPKTVETSEERQKLTFRIKAHIDKDLLKNYVRDVKTGLPGVAYVQLDPQAEWPSYLQVRLPE